MALSQSLQHAFQYCDIFLSDGIDGTQPLIIFSSYFATGEGHTRAAFVETFSFDKNAPMSKEAVYESVHERIIKSAGATAYFVQYPDLIVDIPYVLNAYKNNLDTVGYFDLLPEQVRNTAIDLYFKKEAFYFKYKQEMYINAN